MSDIKKKINDFKNIISPYKKKLSDWYKKDKNVKKIMAFFSLLPLIIAAIILQRTWRGVRRIEASQMITLSLISSMVQTKPNTEVDMLNNLKKAKKLLQNQRDLKVICLN